MRFSALLKLVIDIDLNNDMKTAPYYFKIQATLGIDEFNERKTPEAADVMFTIFLAGFVANDSCRRAVLYRFAPF